MAAAAVLQPRNALKIVWDDYELPYIPSEDTVSFSYNEWRSAWSDLTWDYYLK